jgi:DNA-binding winged helix-turn-helix (wHTH) protein/tetratricopeptide (TPR) repeat protein
LLYLAHEGLETVLTQKEKNRVFRFGRFLIDISSRELRKDGVEVVIQPRVFDLLIYLIENHERAVDKDELQDAVWPGMVITETALTRAVMKARKAVDDDASTQATIKTLHGHGYRFIAELVSDQPLPVPPIQTAGPVDKQVEPQPDESRKFSLKLVMAVFVALVLVASLTWVVLRPHEGLASDTRIAVLPLTDKSDNPELAWASLGLMSYATNLINLDGALQVVPDGNVVSLTSNFLWNGNLDDPETAELIEKLRRVYGASHIVSMELESQGIALRMNYGLLGPDGSLQRGTLVGDQGTELTQGVVQSIFGLLLRKRYIGGDATLVSEDPFNNEAFARGMSLTLEGRCAEAVNYYEVIIEQEPGLFAPRFEKAACLRILGESEVAESILDELIIEQRELGTEQLLAKSLMTLGILYNRTGRLDLAEQAYKEALTLSEAVADRVLSAKILQNLSIVVKDRSQFEEAEELLDLAVLAYQEAGLEVLPGQLYSGKANLRMAKGELVEAELFLGQALQSFREIGDRRNEAMMLNNTGYLKRRQGKLLDAEQYHLRSLEIREQIGDRVGVGRVYGMLGVVYTSLGRYDDAKMASESALEVALETNDRLFEATSLAQLADVEKALGNYAAARQSYQQGRLVFVDIQDQMRVLQSDLKLARLDLIENRLDFAESTALLVLEESRENDLMQPEVQALELLGDIEAKRGDRPAAISELREALERVREASWTGKENTLGIKLANLFLDESDLDSAAPLVGALSGQEPNVQSLKVQARYAFERGDAENALKLMQQAKKLAGENWANESETTLLQYQGAN